MAGSSQIIKVPELGENISSVKVLKVLVKVGQTVGAEDSVLELESDKASMEVPASASGKITSLKVKEGDTVKVGQAFMEVELAGGAKEAPPSAEKPAEPAKAAPAPAPEKKAPPAAKPSAAPAKESVIRVKLTSLGENVAEAKILKVSVKPGDKVAVEQSLFEAESEKATMDIPSNEAGEVLEVLVKEGQTVKVGQEIIVLKTTAVESASQQATTEPAAQSASAKAPAQASPQPQAFVPQFGEPAKDAAKPALIFEGYTPVTKSGKIIPASPSVRRFAREIGVDLEQVQASSPSGRLSIDDVKSYAKSLLQKIKSGGSHLSADAPSPLLPDFSAFGEVEMIEMNRIKQLTASHMSLCNRLIPQVTQFDETDITEVEERRKKFKKAAEDHGTRLTMTAIIVKACALALKQMPMLNSSIDQLNSRIIVKKYINIGIAVDTSQGLVVPVIKNAGAKSILEISKDLDELSSLAKSRKLKPDQIKGATFTISNLGGIAGSFFTPIVSWPEVAILGVGRGALKPVHNGSEFQPRLMLPLSLSYDHRVVDGADGARFIKFLSEAISDPFALSFY